MDTVSDGYGPAPLQIERTTDSDHAVRLVTTGEIDMSTVGRFAAAVGQVLADPLVLSCTIDFAGLDFIDSLGVEALMHAHRLAGRRQVTFTVCNAHGRVLRVFEILGVDKLLLPAS